MMIKPALALGAITILVVIPFVLPAIIIAAVGKEKIDELSKSIDTKGANL